MKHKNKSKVSRRRFIGDSTLAGLGGIIGLGMAPQFLRASAQGANERLTFAYIGTGSMASGHIGRGLELRDHGRVNIAALCDVDSDSLAAAARRVGDACETYSDYRKMLERKDIDAVVIGTPDHWHALQTIHACEAGKHVYVEKPASCTPAGGRAMVDAARNSGCIVQVGAQGRSGLPTQKVANFIRNGMIGKVHKVTCWHNGNPSGGPRRTEDPPANLDWDAWLGPLSMRPFIRGAYHPNQFRWMMESGGGNIRDRGAHLFSNLFWCLGADGQTPVSVEATGDPRPNGAWDIPVNMKVVYKFKDPDWELIWDQPGVRPEGEEPSHPLGSRFGTVFHGDKDSVILFDQGSFSEPSVKVRDYSPPADGFHAYRMDKHNNDQMNHTEDWMQAIKENRLPCMDIEIGHRVATLTYLGNMAYVAGRKLEWDGVKEVFTNTDIDQTLIWKSLRQPYV